VGGYSRVSEDPVAHPENYYSRHPVLKKASYRIHVD